MPISHIHTYLVRPNKGVENVVAATGNSVPQEGQLFSLLNDIYNRADEECSIGIAFRRGNDGAQANVCRSILINYLTNPDIENGRILADKLSGVTTKRSGLGLMFLLYGIEGAHHKVVISRFRANNGVLVDDAADALTVEFIDRVFMKNAHSYKAVWYQHESLAAGFWSGHAVDKQINSRDAETSNYWVRDFLESEFLTTPAMGTRRLALALKDAANRATDLQVKQQITAAATLAPGIEGHHMNANEFCDRFGFSAQTREQVLRAFPRPDLAGDNFVFNAEEFFKQLPYKTVELDSGAVLTAQSSQFDEVFDREEIDNDEFIFSTKGKIVTEKLEKTK
ncbi:MAG TPA: hypothetical protein DFK19_18180 [Ochrobactrum sp.]|nr:hypothetical protein [Ochrobactrum sp.]